MAIPAPGATHDINGVPIGDVVQRKAESGPGGQAYRPPNRTGLPDRIKTGIEALSSLSMDHLRVHYNSPEPARLQAHAFTRGADIHLAPGQERHLEHEAWHAVQQAKGRVAPTARLTGGIAVNGDTALEREADTMGRRAQAANLLPGLQDERTSEGLLPVRSAGERLSVPSTTQFVAPGGIEHVMNSCFVAALINTFTVVRPLRNLLNPERNNIGNYEIGLLQQLLWRAVNTVDAQKIVPEEWIRHVMAALQLVGAIDNAVDTADFSDVLGRVIDCLTEGDGVRAQANGQPIGTGEVVWFPGSTLQDAVADRVQHMQQAAGANNLTPNSVHITRQEGTQGIAPQSFNLYPANGTTVTYHLRTVIRANDAYVGGHFTSYVDRNGDGAAEWWLSDDLSPGNVAQVPNLTATGMTRAGRAYVYERAGSTLAAHTAPKQVGRVIGETSRLLTETYDEAFANYLQWEEEDPVSEEDLAEKRRDTMPYDKDLRPNPKVSDPVSEQDGAFKLPAVSTSPAMLDETRRQLRLQLDSLNRMTVKDWAFHLMLNRMKSADQLVEGYSTDGGTDLKNKVDYFLRRNLVLARALLEEIQDRMIRLQDSFDPVSEAETRAMLERIYNKAEAAKHAEQPWYYFEYNGGMADLATLSRLSIKGGIGRQHGEGDNTWFRRVHKPGIALFEHGTSTTSAVLHNPDQVAGGQMEIFHNDEEEIPLEQARSNFIRARDLYVSRKKTGIGRVTDAERSALAAAEVYKDLIGRYMGDGAVNSLLGRTWIEVLPDKETRIGKLLDQVTTIPLEHWQTTRMSVSMDVINEDDHRLKPLAKKQKTIAKQEKNFQSVTTKLSRKGGGGRKAAPKDFTLRKVYRADRQTTLDEIAFRRRKPTAPDKTLLHRMSGPQLRLDLRARVYREYLDYVRRQEHPQPVDGELARWSFRQGHNDHERYMAYFEEKEARRLRDEGESDEDETRFQDTEMSEERE